MVKVEKKEYYKSVIRRFWMHYAYIKKLMKKKLADLFRNRKIAAGVTAIVLAVAVGSTAVVQQKSQIPELPSYTDPVLETTIEEEETPLASAPKVNTTTSKKL